MLIEDLLAALRASLEGRRAQAVSVADRVRCAADGYVAAVDADLAAELAARHGLPVEEGSRIPGALAELRAALEALISSENARTSTSSEQLGGPVATQSRERAPVVVVTAAPVPAASVRRPPRPAVVDEDAAPAAQASARGSSAAVSPLVPASAAAAHVSTVSSATSSSATGSANRRTGTDPPEVADLVAEWDALDLKAVPDNIFRTYAEEFAARARGLQEKGVGGLAGQASISRLIRRITRMVSDRGVYVFGLALSHTANWTQVAERARRDRERLLYAEPKPLTQRLVIPNEDASDE